MLPGDRRRLLVTIPGALVAGGVAGAGVGLRWYGPPVGVGLAVLIGLAAGGVVLSAARKAKRARLSRSLEARTSTLHGRRDA